MNDSREIDWDLVRDTQFPVARNWAYFDHAAVSPLPRRSGEVLREWTFEQEQNGVVGWPEQERRLELARDRVAGLINAHRDEIAFINSTTHSIGLIAEGYPWRDGDSVVTAAEEYPSNLLPWMNLAARGVEVRQVASREGRIWLEDLVAAIDRSTRLLAISHVEFATGFRNDLDALAEICQARGVALFVDAIQGLGPYRIDVRRTPIDFLAADGHKWLLGPEGAGFLFIRRDWIDRLRTIGVGWHSVVGSYNAPRVELRLKPNAQRWEGGSFSMPGLLTFGASVELFHEWGLEAVARRIVDRAEAVRELAATAGWTVYGSLRESDRSTIVVLERAGVDPAAAAIELRRTRGLVVACRRGRLRISPHVYNNQDDLERLRAGLEEIH
ncbi:MAG: aminotransferase class V-fold PLP-dependent enzyme [Isosphaeraceae bacterium]